MKEESPTKGKNQPLRGTITNIDPISEHLLQRDMPQRGSKKPQPPSRHFCGVGDRVPSGEQSEFSTGANSEVKNKIDGINTPRNNTPREKKLLTFNFDKNRVKFDMNGYPTKIAQPNELPTTTNQVPPLVSLRIQQVKRSKGSLEDDEVCRKRAVSGKGNSFGRRALLLNSASGNVISSSLSAVRADTPPTVTTLPEEQCLFAVREPLGSATAHLEVGEDSELLLALHQAVALSQRKQKEEIELMKKEYETQLEECNNATVWLLAELDYRGEMIKESAQNIYQQSKMGESIRTKLAACDVQIEVLQSENRHLQGQLTRLASEDIKRTAALSKQRDEVLTLLMNLHVKYKKLKDFIQHGKEEIERFLKDD